MEEKKETVLQEGLVCEDVISIDSVALEMMKIILDRSIKSERTLKNRIKSALGLENKRFKHNIPEYSQTAQLAYGFAEAFIKEMERRKQHE